MMERWLPLLLSALLIGSCSISRETTEDISRKTHLELESELKTKISQSVDSLSMEEMVSKLSTADCEEFWFRIYDTSQPSAPLMIEGGSRKTKNQESESFSRDSVSISSKSDVSEQKETSIVADERVDEHRTSKTRTRVIPKSLLWALFLVLVIGADIKLFNGAIFKLIKKILVTIWQLLTNLGHRLRS